MRDQIVCVKRTLLMPCYPWQGPLAEPLGLMGGAEGSTVLVMSAMLEKPICFNRKGRRLHSIPSCGEDLNSPCSCPIRLRLHMLRGCQPTRLAVRRDTGNRTKIVTQPPPIGFEPAK